MAIRILPQPVAFPEPTEQIPQATLTHILQLRGEIKEQQKTLEQLEGQVQAALEDSVPLEPGLLRAFLKIVERRSVPWKQVVERKLGVDFAKRVLAGTKPDRFTHLIVTA